jgi:hypothetical protein
MARGDHRRGRSADAAAGNPTAPRRRARGSPGAPRDGDADEYLAHKEQAIAVHEGELPGIAELIKQWSTARLQHTSEGAVMIARDNYTRQLANRAARTQLKRERLLPHDGVLIGGREYAPGDRVIARRNHRRHDIDNGTLATVTEIAASTGAMIVQTDRGELRALDQMYVADHLQHASRRGGRPVQWQRPRPRISPRSQASPQLHTAGVRRSSLPGRSPSQLPLPKRLHRSQSAHAWEVSRA